MSANKIKQNSAKFAIIFFATVFSAVTNFGVQVILARTLGPKEYGALASALAVVSMVIPLACFGLAGYWFKVFGKEGFGALRWLSACFSVVKLSTTFVLAVLFMWAWYGPHDSQTRFLIIVLETVVLGQLAAELGGAKFQLEGSYKKLAIWQTLPQLLRFCGIVVLIFTFSDEKIGATHVASIYMVVSVIMFALWVLQAKSFSSGKINLEGHSNRNDSLLFEKISNSGVGIIPVIASAWPFCIENLMYIFYYQGDIVLLKYMVGEASAGMYGACVTIISGIYIFPGVLYQQFLLPKLHRWANHSLVYLKSAHRNGALIMSGFGVIIAILLWLSSSFILALLYGKDYSDVHEVLKILSLAIPLRFFGACAGALLTASGFVKKKIKISVVAAVINIISNLFLIPSFGLIGASIATVLTEAFTTIAFSICIKYQVKSVL